MYRFMKVYVSKDVVTHTHTHTHTEPIKIDWKMLVVFVVQIFPYETKKNYHNEADRL